MTIIIYSTAKGTLKQEQQEKERIIMILITDNQVTSFLDTGCCHANYSVMKYNSSIVN